jgi:hypothetical protein
MERLATIGLVFLVFGCADVVNSDGAAGSGGTAAGGAGGTAVGGTGGGVGTLCGGSNSCVPDPGAAWTGPIALADSATGCSGAFPDEAATLFEGLDAGTASCDCTCIATAVCSTQMNVVGFSGVDCVGPQGQQSISELVCYNSISDSHSVTLGAATTSCGAGTVTENIPAPMWSQSVSACDGFAPGDGACDPGETCMPTPGAGFEAGLCYSQVGDHRCPADFPNKTLFYTTFSDTRECASTCSCLGSGASCSVSVTGYAMSSCVSPQGAKTVFSGGETCVATDTNAVRSILPGAVVVQDDGTCTPGALNPTGTVTEEGATTVCCN